jgi:hypothetical protein
MDFIGSRENTEALRQICFVLFIVYIFYFLYDFFLGDEMRALWTLFAILLALIPFLFERYFGLYFPWIIKITIILSMLLHTAGEVHRWYYIYAPYYDKISHVVSTLAISYLIFFFIIFVILYTELKWTGNKVIFFIIFLTMAFAFFWEWWELFSDQYFGSGFFWDMPDGVSDIIVDFLAASYVALSANEYLKKRSWKEVSRDFVRTDMKKLYGLENHAMEERARLTDLE